MKTFTTECDCHDFEHSLRFAYVPNPHEDSPPELYVEVHLCSPGFWRRLWKGIRYIFGYKSRYGHFDEVGINRESVDQLRGWLDDYIIAYENWQDKRFDYIYAEDKHIEVLGAINALMTKTATEYVIPIEKNSVGNLERICNLILSRFPAGYREMVEVTKGDDEVRLRTRDPSSTD